MSNTEIILLCKSWVEKFVIELSLCPFAKQPYENDSVRFVIEKGYTVDDWLKRLLKEFRFLKNNSADIVSNTLIIFPTQFPDFLDYLSFYDLVQMTLEDQNLSNTFQLASFHPEYQFEGTEKEEVSSICSKSQNSLVINKIQGFL